MEIPIKKDYALNDYQKTKRNLEKYVVPDISSEIFRYIYHEYELTQFKRSEIEGKFNKDKCSICLKTYSGRMFILPCLHKFHTWCIFFEHCKNEDDVNKKIQHQLMILKLYINSRRCYWTINVKNNDNKCPLCHQNIEINERNAIKKMLMDNYTGIFFDSEDCIPGFYFTLYPKSYKPTGHINFSRMR